jgi:hypothetical protein
MTSRATDTFRQGFVAVAKGDEGESLGRLAPSSILSDAERASVAGRGCAQERSRPVHRIAA